MTPKSTGDVQSITELAMGRTPRRHTLTGCRRRLPLRQASSHSRSIHLSHAKVGFCDFLQSLYLIVAIAVATVAVLPPPLPAFTVAVAAAAFSLLLSLSPSPLPSPLPPFLTLPLLVDCCMCPPPWLLLPFSLSQLPPLMLMSLSPPSPLPLPPTPQPTLLPP
jgi:hypothetical protein